MDKSKKYYEDKLRIYKDNLKELINKLREFHEDVYKPLIKEIELKDLIIKKQNT